jgi:hypothetical protein
MGGERPGPGEGGMTELGSDSYRADIEAFRSLEAEAKTSPDNAELQKRVTAERASLSEKLRSAGVIHPNSGDEKLARALRSVVLQTNLEQGRASHLEPVTDSTPMSNPEQAFAEAEVGAANEAETEQRLLAEVRLAIHELARVYDDVVATAEMAIDGEGYVERAKSILREVFEQVAEQLETAVPTDIEIDDFPQQTETILTQFSGGNDQLEEAKVLLGDAFGQLMELKDDIPQAAA